MRRNCVQRKPPDFPLHIYHGDDNRRNPACSKYRSNSDSDSSSQVHNRIYAQRGVQANWNHESYRYNERKNPLAVSCKISRDFRCRCNNRRGNILPVLVNAFKRSGAEHSNGHGKRHYSRNPLRGFGSSDNSSVLLYQHAEG